MTALDAATGEELWKFQKGYFDGVPSYAVSDGVLYVGVSGRQRVRLFPVLMGG